MMHGLLFLLLLLGPRALASPWDFSNDPHRFGEGYQFQFSTLPLSGTVDPLKMPWSESYWPRNKGSINLRWNTPNPDGFDYRSPSRDEVLKLSVDELKALSPTEKYDLFRGLYDYPMRRYIRSVDSNRSAPDWSGICDGWTAASIEFREPAPVNRVNPDGVVIPFGSSDVKGLISYTAARQKLNSIVIGRYCPFGLGLGFSNCQDINPGAYHVILANEIGLRHQAFPGEIDPGHEAWNQPIVGYEFTVLGSARIENQKSNFSGTALRIHSRLHYVDELDQSRFDPVIGTPFELISTQESDYVLELDLNGLITGGYWISKYQHPDVFWRPTKEIEFTGDFARLKEIYEPVKN